MTFIIRDLDLPRSIILAKIEFTFDSLREDALLCPKLERFCSIFYVFRLIIVILWKRCQ